MYVGIHFFTAYGIASNLKYMDRIWGRYQVDADTPRILAWATCNASEPTVYLRYIKHCKMKTNISGHNMTDRAMGIGYYAGMLR